MTKFPIANMLRGGTPVETILGYCPEIIPSRDWANELTSTVFFDVDIASELYWLGRKNYYSLKKDFGPIAPPYDDIWMEWKVPARVNIDGEWRDTGVETQWAAHVTTIDVDYTKTSESDIRLLFDSLRAQGKLKAEPTDDEYQQITQMYRTHMPKRTADQLRHVRVELFVRGLDKVCVHPMPKGIQIDQKTGFYNKHARSVDYTPNSIINDDKAIETMREFGDFNVVWLALQLVNCRNVTTRSVGSVFTRSGVEKRRGEPVVKYHTIVLPGTTTARSKSQRKPKQDVLALHKVRGHFKTFTAERPLMGQHVGTYWWGWQVRGNAKNGAVISDYRLGPGAA